MKTHESKSEKVIITCDFCDNVYADIKYLSRHIKAKHPKPDVVSQDTSTLPRISTCGRS